MIWSKRKPKPWSRKPIQVKKRIVTLNMPIPYLEAMQILVDVGLFNSRSEVVRVAITEFLDKEAQFISDLTNKTIKILGEKK